MSGDKCSDKSPRSRCNLEKHADADVGVSFFYVGRSGAGGGCDNGDERGAYRVADVHVKHKCQQRHDNDATPQTGERTEKPRQKRADPDEYGE